MSKNPNRSLVVASGAFLLCPTAAFTQEVPFAGSGYNTKETNSIVYVCKPSDDESIDCEFTQMRIRKTVKEEDWKEGLDLVRQAYSEWKALAFESCMFEIGKLKAFYDLDFDQRFASKVLNAITAACKSKTEADVLNVFRILFDREARTCVFGSHTFSQRFRLVHDPVSDARAWVATGEPSGACGTVQLSRFEKKDSHGVVIWNYV